MSTTLRETASVARLGPFAFPAEEPSMRTTLAFVLGLAVVGLTGIFTPSAAATRGTTWPCQDVTGFSNTTLTIVTTVNAAAGKTWTFDSAPSVIAQRLLTDLNNNSSGIVFKEANGVVPNLYFNVTLSENNSGTLQDQAYVTVTGLAKAGTLFTDNSGQGAFVGWQGAVDKLASNMLSWLEQGWHTNPPCRRPDGSIRTQWPDTYTPRSK